MKTWLMERFLPMWAKQTLFGELSRLQSQNRSLRQHNRELKAYIKGLRRHRKGGVA